MKETFYFSHDYNAQTDEKMLELRMEFGWEGYGIFWALIEKMAQNNGLLKQSSSKCLAFDMQIDSKFLQKVIDFLISNNTFLIDKNDSDIFYSKRLLEHIKKRKDIKEKRAIAGRKGANAKQMLNKGLAKSSKGKESKEKENKEDNNIIINNNKEQSSEILKEVEEAFGKKEINNLQDFIKEQVGLAGFIYKPGRYERARIKNLLEAKKIKEVLEKFDLDIYEFVQKIIYISTKLPFWAGKINNAETFYKHYDKVLNEAIKLKQEKQQEEQTFKNEVF